MEKQINPRLSDTIMGQSRHQFLYGYNGKDREKFLKDMAKKYPVELDKSNPIGIYLDCIGLPKIPQTNNDINEITLSTFSREYCLFSIITNLLDTTFNQVEKKDLNERSIVLLNRINHLHIDDELLYAKNLQELNDILNESKNTYAVEYEKYVRSGNFNNFIASIRIKFINFDMFIRYYKQMINTESYIGIIVDHQEPIALKSQQAINGLVGSRINADISMKVACEPDNWDTYYDLNGTLVEYIHDYGTAELDDSNHVYTKRLKKSRIRFEE